MQWSPWAFICCAIVTAFGHRLSFSVNDFHVRGETDSTHFCIRNDLNLLVSRQLNDQFKQQPPHTPVFCASIASRLSPGLRKRVTSTS